MRYLSVCSGIEAATVAWHHMGWTPVAFSEIEKFPSQVLNHHYQSVPNVGDMTKFEEWNLESVELLVGGTPCQSFSVAGLRKGLDDPRGNLMLTYGAIAKRFKPKWLVWENVPGVLSSNGGRDFGTFLGMLAELGYGFAYRVLDAQYFGVAQRRRRVFVVGCLGNWRAAAAVLFERDSLCGNPAPSRTQRERAPTFFESSLAQYRQDNVGGTLKASGGVLGGGSETFVRYPKDIPEVMSTLLSSTAGVSRTGNAATEHETYIPMSFRKSKRAQTSDDDESWVQDEVTNTINLFDQGDVRTTQAILQPIPIDTMNHIGRKDNHSFGDFEPGAPSYTLTKGHSHAVAQPVAFSRIDDGRDATNNLCPTLRIGGNADGVMAVAQPIAFTTEQTPKFNNEQALTLTKSESKHNQCVMQSMAVRRLTPVECERLQGFPDGYTNIRENCPDGPRYKALGNSMAVPVMRWIGQRIQAVEEI